MKKTTRCEMILAVLLSIPIVWSLIYIFIEQSRGFISSAFLYSNIFIIILFIGLLIFPVESIKFKTNIMDKIVTLVTSFSLSVPFAITLYLWGVATIQNPQEPVDIHKTQVSFLNTIDNYTSFYYFSFLILLLSSLYSLIKPLLIYIYNKKEINMNTFCSVQCVMKELNFTANKTDDGITVKLTGKTTTGKNIDYSVTKNSASDLINDIDNNYPEIKFEVLKKLLDAIKILE